MSYELTGLEGKIAVVTGAGRMRSIGRSIALELAKAGCDVVITGSGRSPDAFPADEKKAGWRDIESVAEEIRALGRRALPLISNVADLEAVKLLLANTENTFTTPVFNGSASLRSAAGELFPDSGWRLIRATL